MRLFDFSSERLAPFLSRMPARRRPHDICRCGPRIPVQALLSLISSLQFALCEDRATLEESEKMSKAGPTTVRMDSPCNAFKGGEGGKDKAGARGDPGDEALRTVPWGEGFSSLALRLCQKESKKQAAELEKKAKRPRMSTRVSSPNKAEPCTSHVL